MITGFGGGGVVVVVVCFFVLVFFFCLFVWFPSFLPLLASMEHARAGRRHQHGLPSGW